MEILRKLYRFLKPYRFTVLAYIGCNFLMVSMAMIGPFISREFFDRVIYGKQTNLIFLLMAIFTAQVLGRHIVHYIRSYFMTRDLYRFVNDMRAGLFRKLMSQTKSYMRRQNTGEILTVLNNDTEFIRSYINYNVATYSEWLLLFIFGSIMLAIINPWSLLICYMLLPFVYIVGRLYSKKSRVNQDHIRDASARLGMMAQENINGMRIVRAFASEKFEERKFDETSKDFRDANLRQTKLWAKYNIPLYLMGVAPHFFSLAAGSLLVIYGKISIGDYVAVGSYITHILAPVINLPNFLLQSRQMFTSAQRMFNFLDMGVDIKSPENAVCLEEKECHISLKNVTFSVNSKVLLDDISLDIPQGKSLGIVGATGSGKTALCNLLCRFTDPVSGEIAMNGHAYRDIELDSLRRQIAYVPQDVFLFSETIAKNIALSRPDAGMDEISNAAVIAQASSFISQLPDGYETIIGERGIGLSGGQKQRLSIARAIVKDSPVIIFDDSSSALDSETEKELMHALYTRLGQKTKIIVAHKISSVKYCDEIIVLENGRIIERGTHDELVLLGGKYFSVFREQTQMAKEAI